MNLKKMLWKNDLLPNRFYKCPRCGSRIEMYGHPKPIGFLIEQSYRCTNDKCGWEK
ncbi:MAG: hypothetical protein GW780_03085 [Candidatus Aenigmarchaeota archaeon]|nr:hypothetical protein [Candidatus Aenigmarchaeota archaeon]